MKKGRGYWIVTFDKRNRLEVSGPYSEFTAHRLVDTSYKDTSPEIVELPTLNKEEAYRMVASSLAERTR
jgi:hypothetical protein